MENLLRIILYKSLYKLYYFLMTDFMVENIGKIFFREKILRFK